MGVPVLRIGLVVSTPFAGGISKAKPQREEVQCDAEGQGGVTLHPFVSGDHRGKIMKNHGFSWDLTMRGIWLDTFLGEML